MNHDIAVNHITLYFDAVMEEDDGNGWCVEFSDSDITVRFSTFMEATMYTQIFTPWLMGNNKEIMA